MNLKVISMLAVTTFVVAACGGDGGSSSVSQTGTPMVSAFAVQTINQDTPVGPVSFTATDDGGADALVISGTTSDPSIVSVDGISFGGSGVNRTVSVTPLEDAVGRVNVQITAKDAQGNVGFTILPLQINAVNQSITAYTNSTFAKDENDMPVQVTGFTFIQDGDDDNTFTALVN